MSDAFDASAFDADAFDVSDVAVVTPFVTPQTGRPVTLQIATGTAVLMSLSGTVISGNVIGSATQDVPHSIRRQAQIEEHRGGDGELRGGAPTGLVETQGDGDVVDQSATGTADMESYS